MKQYVEGEKIGGEFTVLKVFGGALKSGMGVVYLVADRTAPFPYVLKTLQQPSSLHAKNQFIAEAHAWINAGSHENIVRALWAREFEDQLFVAAEYIRPDEDGRNNLNHYLGGNSLPLEVSLVWASQFCYGMDYAKSKGILAHRDIKPENLMIDSNGQLKITDFGLAKSIEIEDKQVNKAWWPFNKKEPLETYSKTRTGSMMGTLPYMAPEQFIDAKSVNHTADIYSFGVILYQMISGNSYPYKINTDSSEIDYEFFNAHTSQEPIQINSPLMSIIWRCLKKNPAERYESYDYLLKDINALAKANNFQLPKQSRASKEHEELYSKAQSYVALGDSEKALKVINEYVSIYSENECGWTEKGRIHFEREEYDRALNATKKSISLNPYNTHSWNNYGVLLDKTGAQFDDIKHALLNALSLDSLNTSALINLVGPSIQNNRNLDAAKYLANALRIRPEKPLVLSKSKALLRMLMEKSNFDEAKILLESWTQARPNDLAPWHNLGLIYERYQEIDKAILCFSKVIGIDRNDDFALSQLAKLTFHAKKGKLCIDYCNELLKRGKDILLAITLKARTLNFMGAYGQAIEFLKPYIENNPNNDALLVVLADIHEYRENLNEALIALNKAKYILEKSSNQQDPDNLNYINSKINNILSAQR